MGRFLTLAVAFAVGLLVGGFGALSLGGGAMMGAGAATGLMTGVCMVVEAADKSGLLTPEQIDEILAQAASDTKGSAVTLDAGAAGASLTQCAEFMGKLKASG